MDQFAAVRPPGLEDLLDGLVPFCEDLRKDGFGLEPAQVTAAHALILDMAEHGRLPEALSGLETLIGPIFCSSQRQQEEFSRRFRVWVKTLETNARVAPARLFEERDLGLKLQDVARRGRRAWMRTLPWFVAGAVALLGAGYAVANRFVGDTQPTATPGKAVDFSALLVPLSNMFLGLVAAGFVVIAVLWLVRRWSRRWWDGQAEMVLRRRAAQGTPRTTILKIRPPDPWPARERQSILRAAVGLLRRIPVEAGREVIDVPATVARSIRKPGPSEPVPARRLITPEYLVLVDRISLRDHQADWADALVHQLVAQDLEMVRFEFAGDPRVCYPRRDPGPAWTLSDLAARYPDHRLLVFSDAAGFTDARTGRPAPWVEVFTQWQVRAVLTPLPPASWGALEDDLAGIAFLLEPATPAGLASLAARIAALGGEASGAHLERIDGQSEPVPPMPAPLRTEPGRWLDPVPPPVEEAERMARDLRWYLKESYDWLAACAVYPELHWDLTLELGRLLSVLDGLRRLEGSGLSRLVRLPWFRQGALPEWLRLWLLSDLPARTNQAVRGALEQLLVGSERVENAGFTTGPTLTIAQAAGGAGTLSALAQGVRRSLARNQEGDGPMRDYIFATFLEGRIPGPLDVRLPANIRALLLDKPGRAKTLTRKVPGDPGWLDYLLVMPLSFVYWGLIVVTAGPALLIWGTKNDLLSKALFSGIWGALFGLQILAMRLPFRIAAGLPLPWYRTAVHFLWWVCVSFLTAGAVGYAAGHLSSFVLSAPQPSPPFSRVMGIVTGLALITVWGVCLVWGLRQLRGDPTHAPLRMHRRLALLSVLVGAVEGIVFLMNTLFSRRPLDFRSIHSIFSLAAFVCSGVALFFLLGPQLSIFYLRRIRRVELVVPRSERSRLLAPIRWITSFFKGVIRRLTFRGSPTVSPSARHVEPRPAEVISEPDSISQDAASIRQTGTLSSVGRTLMGAQWTVLQAILDASGDTLSFVEDSQIARTTRIALKDVRDWLETLEREEYVEIARTEAGLSASITVMGRLALQQYRPFPSNTPGPSTSSPPGPAPLPTTKPPLSPTGPSGTPSLASTELPDAQPTSPRQAIRLFYAYSHKDEALRDELEEHLAILKRQGYIVRWHYRRIGAGEEWKGQLDKNLEEAQIILLLISPSFLASDYCYDIETKRALDRHDKGEAKVIPILLRPVDWEAAPFARLQGLPINLRPVTTWTNKDEAFNDIAQGIRRAIEESRNTELPDAQPTSPRQAIRLFCAYSYKDEALRDELEEYLALLKRQGYIVGWHDRRIGAGEEWKDQLDKNLEEAQIILLLISPSFLASDYCYDIETRRALDRHDKGEATVIPVLLRPVDWKGAPFARLRGLPINLRPVTTWTNKDEAFKNIAQGIRRAIEGMRNGTR